MANKYSIIIIILVLLLAGGFVYRTYLVPDKVLSSQEAAEKAIAYINKYMLPEGNEATLIETGEENGVYKIRLKIGESEYESYITKNGKLLFQFGIDLEESPEVAGEQVEQEEELEYPKTIGDFLVLDKEVCFENERPLVYFFGHTGCPHCVWEEPVMKKTAEQFGDLIAFHNNMDSEEDSEVFDEYREINGGGVPFLVFGCNYVRVGSGERLGEEEEIKALTAIICKLTDGEPKEICGEIEELVESIE